MTTKDVLICSSFIAACVIKLMKSEKFLRLSHTHFSIGREKMNIGSGLCLFICVPDTLPEANSTTIQSERIARIFISVPFSGDCVIAVKKRTLPKVVVILDDTTGMSRETKLMESFALRSTSLKKKQKQIIFSTLSFTKLDTNICQISRKI